MKQNNKKSSITSLSGFTLVELLVVISIIGILAGIVYANFGDARATARDEARKVALKEVQLAIELYKAQNGRYPAKCFNNHDWSGAIGTYACSGNTPYIIGLTPDYIAELPFEETTLSEQGYLYKVNSSGSNYKLMANSVVEKNKVTGYDDEFARCPRSYNINYCGTTPEASTYAVYSPGAASW